MIKIGTQSVKFNNPPTLLECSSIVGPKESKGPLSKYFDKTLEDEFWGESSWEKAESKIIKEAASTVITKSNLTLSDLDCMFAGDLLNQCISSSFGLRELSIPFFGVFGACSTFVESMILAGIATESFANNVLFATSSHFCSAEKQFRFPLELGTQRPQTSQWTVTGSGSGILSKNGNGPYLTHFTIGKIVDMGIKDANNMGAAMAPAFVQTLIAHFKDTGRSPNYYDAIISGDLGYVGKDIAIDIAKCNGYDISHNYNDCGVLIFDKENQDTHSGGSGCACCATVFSGYFFKKLKEQKIQKILLIATGALMNTTSSQQGESIPGIAHAVSIEI